MTDTVQITVEAAPVLCPLTQLDFDAFADLNFDYFQLEVQLSMGSQVVSYEDLYNDAIDYF